MKKIISILICFIVLIAVCMPKVAYADIGPKPSIHVDFVGAGEQEYWATLIGRTGGPWGEYNGNNARYEVGDKEYDAWLKFIEFSRENNLFFTQFVQNCTETDKLSWTYYPPYEFKVLVYFPESDTFAISGDLERYRFDSYFTVDLKSATESNVGNLYLISARTSYDYIGEILKLLMRIAITMIVELGICCLFGILKKQKIWQKVSFILVVNFITQLLLNVVMYLSNYTGFGLAIIGIFILSEIIITAIESVAYAIYFVRILPMDDKEKKKTRIKSIIYGITANITTMILGIVLSIHIPTIF